VSDGQSDGGSGGLSLKRDISRIGASFIVLNGLIGAGIYALPAVLLERAGGASPWLFILFGTLMITVILSFAALASYFRRTGGPVLYATVAFGPFAGFQVGWINYIGRITAVGANTNVMINYAAMLWPQIGDGVARAALILLFISYLTLVNIWGVKRAVTAMGVFSLLKIAPLIGLIIVGLSGATGAVHSPMELIETSNISSTALLLLYAFIGFEGVLFTAGETKSPRRNIPKALIATVAIIAVFYFLVQLVYVAVAPSAASGTAPLVVLGEAVLGPLGANIIALTAVFSVAGNLLSSTATAPRITFALAEEQSLPRWFGSIHHKFRTPHNSILFFGVIGAVLAISGSFIYLAIVSTLARMVMFIICFAALPKITRSADDATKEHALLLPGGYTIPLVATALCGWAASTSSGGAWLMLGGLIAIGSLFYVLARHGARS
jgi:basic amino acid/polyamine antiporter, APA family